MSAEVTAPMLPAAHFVHLARFVRRWGVPEHRLFAGLPFGVHELSDPELALPVPKAVALLERARTLTGEPGLGVYLGLRSYSGEHGYLGFAAMCASTLREGIELTVRYAPVRTTAFAFSLQVDGPRASLVVEERADFGSVRDIVLISLLLGMRHMATVHLGRESSRTAIHLSLPEPAYYARFRDVRPKLRFGRQANELVFDAALLDAPLATADPTSLRLARDQCERLLAATPAGVRLVDRVARYVLRSDGGQRSCEEIAALLDLSPRTLRRRLAGQGTTFQAIRGRELSERATFLLRSGDLSVSEIASRLGYANAANLARALRQWTGETLTASGARPRADRK